MSATLPRLRRLQSVRKARKRERHELQSGEALKLGRQKLQNTSKAQKLETSAASELQQRSQARTVFWGGPRSSDAKLLNSNEPSQVPKQSLNFGFLTVAVASV